MNVATQVSQSELVSPQNLTKLKGKQLELNADFKSNLSLLKKYDTMCKTAKERIKDNQNQIKKAQVDLTYGYVELDVLKSKLEDVQDEKQETQNDLTKENKEINALSKEINSVRKQKNKFINILNTSKKSIESIKQETNDVNSDIENLQIEKKSIVQKHRDIDEQVEKKLEEFKTFKQYAHMYIKAIYIAWQSEIDLYSSLKI